ncbi:tryptophan synthase subunit alpha [bacterium]|nr:tryptophan synthase subunit alpha [bacterium]
MSVRLLNRLLKERAVGNKLFVPFITAGDRSLEFTGKAVIAMADAGADAIELGVPFSDPIAEGPVIQQASQRALEKGTTLEKILQMVKAVRRKTTVPIILMGYLNPFIRNGAEKTATHAFGAGVDGFVIPDLPPDEAEDWVAACRKKDLDTIFLAAPTSTPERLQAVANTSTGYVYYVSVTGTTGMRHHLPKDLKQSIEQVKQYTALPVLVGFGISTPAQAKKAAGMADGVIVGSAMVSAMAGAVSDKISLTRLTGLCREMVTSVKKG